MEVVETMATNVLLFYLIRLSLYTSFSSKRKTSFCIKNIGKRERIRERLKNKFMKSYSKQQLQVLLQIILLIVYHCINSCLLSPH